MASSGGGKKNKKNKWKTVALEDILPNTTVRATTSWADEVENELTADTLQKITSISLPTAPRAACDVVIDESQIPPDGPYIAYLSNLPYEITEDDIAQQFKELKVSEIQLPKDSRSDRMRGFGYVQFSDKSTLIAALHQREMTIKGRTVRISLASEDEKDKDKGSSRSMGGGSMSFTRNRDSDRFDGPDKTAGDWRAAAVPAHENDKNSSYRSRRNNDYGNYRFERDSDRGKQEGGIFSRAFGGRDGDRSNNRPFQRFDREEKSGGAFEDRRSSGGGFFGRSRQGTFGGRDDFVRRSREELDKVVEPPKVRPKLQVAPRTIKSDTTDEPVVPSAIFGGAKPVDTAAREREIEEKLSKPSSVSPRRGNSITRNTLPRQMSRSSSTSSVRSVGYRNNVIGSYNDLSNVDGVQSEPAEAKYNDYEEESETREFTLRSDNKTDELSFVSEADTAAESTNYPVRGSSSSRQQEKPSLSQSQTDDAHSALSDKPPYTAHSESYKPPHSTQRESNKSPQSSMSETYRPPQSSQRETYKPPVSSQSEPYKPAPSQQRAEPYKPPSSTQSESHKSFQSQSSSIDLNKSSTINEPSKRSSSVVQEFKPPPRQEFKSPPPPPENFWTRRAQQLNAAAAVTPSDSVTAKAENISTETKEENTSSNDLTTADSVVDDTAIDNDKQQDVLNETDVFKNGEENFEDAVEIKGDSTNLPVSQGEYEDDEKLSEEFNRRQQSEKSYSRTVAGTEFSTYGRGGIYRGTRGGGRGGENRQGYRDGDRNNYRSNRDDRDYRSKKYDNRNYSQNGETKYSNQSDVTDGNAGNSNNDADDNSNNNNNNNNNNNSSINNNTNSSNNEDDLKNEGNKNRGNNRRNDRQRNFNNRPDGGAAASFRNRNPSTSDGNGKQSGSGGASFKKYDRNEYYYRDRNNEPSSRPYGPTEEYKKMKERWHHQRELPKEGASQANSNNSAAVEGVSEKNNNQQSDRNNNEEVSRKFEGNNETKILPSSSNDRQNIPNASSVTQTTADDSGTMEFVCTKTAKRRNNKKKRSNLASTEQDNGNENTKLNDENSKDDNSKGTLTKKLSNEKDKNAKKRDSKQDAVPASKIKEEKRGNLYSLLPSNTELE